MRGCCSMSGRHKTIFGVTSSNDRAATRTVGAAHFHTQTAAYPSDSRNQGRSQISEEVISCRRWHSSAPPLFLEIVPRTVVNLPEETKHRDLFATLNVFAERARKLTWRSILAKIARGEAGQDWRVSKPRERAHTPCGGRKRLSFSTATVRSRRSCRSRPRLTALEVSLAASLAPLTFAATSRLRSRPPRRGFAAPSEVLARHARVALVGARPYRLSRRARAAFSAVSA